MVTKNFNKMLLIAISTASLTSFLGIIISYHINSSTAPTIVLLQSLCFILALSYNKLLNSR
ncbi:metal ABC transporter permease [Avibacterium paragallinarum]|uniref:metal ABC transporter permease n=1 Tax=Avibacterium paragallinarum TaxID=728 RepID=UPI00406D348D